VGDFNGDGKLDLAIANNADSSVSILLRNSANTGFDAKTDFTVGGSANSVAVGDFNGDGKLDLVIANSNNTVSILLRNSANTGFDAKTDFSVGGSANSVAVGDFNSDGKLDLATANQSGNSVSILLRNSANTGFDAKTDFSVGTNPSSVAVGDFNGDGKLDLATANLNGSSVSILLRNSANTGFDAKTDFTVGSNPFSVAVGDFNGDGKQDLATANINGNSVSILLRNSSNTGFDAKTDFIAGNNSRSVAVGDFNGDGKQDLAIANGNDDSVSILLRNSTNTSFDAKTDFTVGGFPTSVAIGDFNGDGKLDLTVANQYNNNISILQNADPSATLTITNVDNQAPTITSGATANFAENGTGIAYTVTATDPDAGTTLTYSISGTDAALFNINSSTGAVTFKTAPNFEAPSDSGANNVYDLTVNASDGSLSSPSKAVAITVTNVNEAPSVTSGATANFAENGTGTAYTVTGSDPDAGTTLTYSISGTDAALFNINSSTGAVTFKTAPNFEAPSDSGANNVYDLTVNANDGSLSSTPKAVAITVTDVNENQAPTNLALSANAIAENTFIDTGIKIGDITITDPDVTGNNNVLTVEGTDAANFEIRNGTELYFQGTSPDFEAQPSYSINLKSTDGALTYSKAFTVDVTNVNEAPTNLALSANAIAENTVIDTGIKIGDITITDPDVTGNNNVLTVEGTDAANFEIRNGTELYFQGTSPDFEAQPSYSINLKSTDVNGGNPLTYSKAFTVNVTNVNEAPTNLALSANAIAENTFIDTGIKIGDITITDPDVTGNNNVLTVEGTDAANFEIRNGTELYFQGTSPDFEAQPSYSINLKSTDVNGGNPLTYSKAFTVNVTNVNEAPTNLALSANAIAENTFIDTGIKIGDITITDPDVTGNNNVLTVEGTDAANFEIRNGTELYFQGTSPDFEAQPSYSINLKSTDVNGGNPLTYSKAFTVNVTNVNETPSITSDATVNFAENGTGTTYLVSATDPDVGTILTYSLTGSVDDALFDINSSTGVVTFKTAPDYENPQDNGTNNVYDITVTASDGTLSDSKIVEITVTDVNENQAPTAVSLQNQVTSLAENTSTDTRIKVADITVTDDGLGTNSLSVSGTDASFFEVDTTGLYLKAGTSLDFETKANYQVTVDVDDATVGNTPDATTAFSLALTNLDGCDL
jgi:CxxC motif-containing protein